MEFIDWRRIDMSKPDLVFYLFRQDCNKLTQLERLIMEIVLVIRVYKELSEIFINRQKKFQMLTRKYFKKEDDMNDVKFMREMVNDILSTNEYSLSGIANCTHIPEDVLTDLAAGLNDNPTFELSRKLFELHASVRKDLYDGIMRKIISEFSGTITS